MLQATENLPDGFNRALNNEQKKEIILDTETAAQVAEIIKVDLLRKLPFALAEILNIISRLSENKLINIDVKTDNIVICGKTGRPIMIDFGLLMPAGARHHQNVCDDAAKFWCATRSPHVPLEYFAGHHCNESATMYSTTHLIMCVIQQLMENVAGYEYHESVFKLFENATALCFSPLVSNFIRQGMASKANERPQPHEFARAICNVFPFKKEHNYLFGSPSPLPVYRP